MQILEFQTACSCVPYTTRNIESPVQMLHSTHRSLHAAEPSGFDEMIKPLTVWSVHVDRQKNVQEIKEQSLNLDHQLRPVHPIDVE